MSLQIRRLHAANPRETLDRWILGSAFVTGLVGIIALKLLPVGVFWSALLSVVILILHARIDYNHKKVALDAEVIGDNCYYMGFLFTLTSLAVALYQLARTGGETVVLRHVIAGFG